MSWGEIYNTSWWGVALDTARTVKARPDFFGSQLNLLTSEQPNLVVNGDFATDSDWTKETGWTISNGVASYNGSASNSAIFQNKGFIIGQEYKLSFSVKNYVSGELVGALSSGSLTGNTPSITENGDYSFNLIATGVLCVFRSTSSFIGSIDNVSVQVVRADLDQIEAKKCLADWIHTTALKDLNN